MADSSEMNNLLENVEQFINDENRIVTYEFLSQSCGIHVNLAKNVLEKYLDNLKKKKQDSSYQVVYSLGGYIGKNLKFLLVRDINLEEAKSKFEKIISLHIYSIQKGKLEKFGVLYNSNITEIKKSIQQCSGQAAISCPAAKLKSPAELASSNVTEVQKNAEPVKLPPSTLMKEETSLDSISLKTEETEHTPQVKATAKEKTSSKLHATKGGKPAIAAFFAAQQAIGRVNPVKEPAVKKVIDEEPKKSVTHKRLIRQSSDDESENENKDNNSEKVKPTKRFKLTEEEKPLQSQETKFKTKKPQKKTKQSSKLSGKAQRKRIQQFSDSESNSDEEEEEVILSSPEMPPPMPAPMSEDDEDVLNATVVEPKNNNKRSRKLVAKTFMDKDGYVVTTKEYETCEENDANGTPISKEKTEEVPKIETKPSVKHPSPPGKTKQKSITSFFTRK